MLNMPVCPLVNASRSRGICRPTSRAIRRETTTG
jgi:hypothetical protein